MGGEKRYNHPGFFHGIHDVPDNAPNGTRQNTDKEKTMPYVNIRVAGTLTKEQKADISSGVTEVIAKVANKPPEAVLVMIDELPHENIAKAGKPLTPPK